MEDLKSTSDFLIEAPKVSLPSGGGAIKSIDEKFMVNAVNGTASFNLPLPFSVARGFTPSITLNYNSGSGNGIFGLGWGLSLPSLKRKTENELPQYFDGVDSDIFVLSGGEDLVPEFKKDIAGEFITDADGNFILNEFPFTHSGVTYTVKRYRPRLEGLFARIERWTDNSAISHWRVISKENITTIYGRNAAARISDPGDDKKIFEWLPEFVYDDKGNCSLYEYKKEDGLGLDPSKLHNKNRANGNATFTNAYLKRIRYGNIAPFKDHPDPIPDRWMFETAFDYGEHDTAAPPFAENTNWAFRPDAFSFYRAGFEIRNCRLCKRILTYHHFAELPGSSALVKSMDFTYDNNGEDGFTFLKEITITGFTKHDDSSYAQKSLPPFSFGYQKHEWNQEIKTISTENLFNAPSGIDHLRYQFVDLYSEGLPGILTEQGSGWFYKTNLGHGNFSPAKLVSPKPSFNGLPSNLQLVELEGDGVKQIAHWQKEPQGFFELNRQGEWQGFRAFENLPSIDFDDPNLRLIDLNGDGRADLLFAGDEVFTWHASFGKKGFDASKNILKNLDEEKTPFLVFSDDNQRIFLADMNGDGLTDLVRIKNGDTCYWPNLGYGRFGAKLSMDQSPVFDHPDQFNSSFIHLADLDGSGTTDIIYLGKGICKMWLNQHGNSFSVSPKIIETFPEISAMSKVSVMDILGNGIGCLVWNSYLPKHQNRPLRYIDLLNGKKPHLLTSYKNNLGKEVELEYKASTIYYTEDKAKGEPWISRLHFPVHCVAKTVTYDRIMKTRFASEYSYHHGYYDFHEKEFRGFGRVDQSDAETVNHFIKSGAANTVTQQDLHQHPVLTKTWFHTGAFLDRHRIINQLSKEYFQNTDVPEKQFQEAILPGNLSSVEFREALRACKGMLLRREVYALDGSPQEKIPYITEQHHCAIKQLQPKENNKFAVFFVHESETIMYHYERNPADPRIAHDFILDVDLFGNILKTVNIVYPKKAPQPGNPANRPEQEVLHVLYSENEYTNVTPKPLDHRSPPLHSTKTYEVKGLAAPGDHFDFEIIKTACNGAVFIDYDKPFTGIPEKRLIEFLRHQYRGDNGITVLPFGTSESKALLHQSFKAAFNESMLSAVFGSKIPLPALQATLTDPQRGGYIFSEGYFWLSSGTRTYDGDHFYVSTQFTNPFGKTTIAEYDANYFLFVKKITDTVNNASTIEGFNYRTLTAFRSKDANDNETAVRMDELGMLVKSFSIGKKGVDPGDQFDDTKVEMKGADDFPSVIMEYNLFEWRNQVLSPGFDITNYKPKPNFFKKSLRETHYNAHPLHETQWQESYYYSDGTGHEVLRKMQAEPGPALQVNPDGTVTQIPDTAPDLRWTGTGRSIVNNKGKIVKQYEPYFSVTPVFDDEKEMVELGVTPVIQYDPLGRIILTRAPNNTFSKVEFTPWQQVDYDFNDTVRDSVWYTKLGSPDPLQPEPANADARAAWLAAKHHNTPKIAHLDTLGRTFLTITDKGESFLNAGEVVGDHKLTTFVRLDIEGNELEIKDALDRPVMQYSYDMLGNRVKQVSMDAGNRWMIKDVTGNPLLTWDDRNHEFSFEYDDRRRLIRSLMKEGAGNAIVVSGVEYGENIVNNKTNNLRSAIHRQYDQSGVVNNNKFDFKGNLLESSKQLADDYQNTVDWTNIPAVGLEAEIFTGSTDYDALNRPIRSVTPNTVPNTAYEILPGYNEAGLLNKVDVKLRGNNAATPFVTSIKYDSKGQREEIFYNNGSKTTYTYDKETFRLTNLKTTRNPGPTILQDLKYVYDPMGNITTIRDDAHADIFFDGEQTRALNNYVYDAMYRLVSATGRKHAGQTDIQSKATLSTNSSFRNHPFIRNNVIDPNDANAFRNYTETYTFDKAGNMKEQKHVSKNSDFTRLFEYGNNLNLNNRLTKTTISGDDYTYTYDAHGNMQGLETVQNEVWNFMDHFKQAGLGGGGTAYYVYDASGNRTRKVIERQNGIILERIYLAGVEIFRERNGADNVVLERETLHVMDGEKRIAMVDTPVIKPAGNNETQLIRYQYDNHLGSASLELDTLAQIISYEEYFPYGTASYSTIDATREVAARRYRYTAKERDEESGLNYHGARYYAPWLCRWTKPDPAGIKDGLNMFVYGKQNPVKYFDPDGKANTPVHDYLTRIIALQYVDKKTAIAIGRAANRPDTETKYESILNSLIGDIFRINQDIHALGKGERDTKVKAILESFNKRNLDNKKAADKIEEAGIEMLHPIQDSSYHLPEVIEGPGLGHVMFPEADLAVGKKSFEEFYQVIKDTEKGLDLMVEKGIIKKSPDAKKKSEAEWREVYDELKAIESKYEKDFEELNEMAIPGNFLVKVFGAIGATIGSLVGGLIGFVVGLFSGNISAGVKEGARIGSNFLQLVFGLPGLGLGAYSFVSKNSLRNQIADEQSQKLMEKYDIADEEDKPKPEAPPLNYDLILK